MDTRHRARVIGAIDAAADCLVALSREIHAHPELAYHEVETVRRLLGVLRGVPGVTIEEGTAGLPTAFRAWVGRDAGPAIGIVCEYDALPMGHACGHNLISTGAVGALVGAAALGSDLPGRVMVMGSPAEEGGGGKIPMVEHGAFDGLAAVLQTHPSDRHRLSGPTIGKAMLVVEFRGHAAHVGSAPDRGINALDAVIGLFNGLNALRQHVRDGSRLYGIITKGGEAVNTIPDHTAAEVGVRAGSESYLEELVARVEACARGAATATGCAVTVTRPPLAQYPPMKLNRALGALLGETLQGLGEEVEGFPPGFEGYANDVAVVSRRVPAALLNYKVGRRGLAEHSTEFMESVVSDEGHRGMLLAAKTMALAAIDLMTDPARLRQIRDEFERADA